jgi:5-methylcytosine-specific restriction endonuclease McrA
MPMARVQEQPKPCGACGVMMSRKRFNGVLEDLATFRLRRFCSLSCANTKNKVGYHGLSWRARKHLKANCEACGSDYMLAAHHRDHNRENNTPENIQTLCVKCHARLHHGTLASPE